MQILQAAPDQVYVTDFFRCLLAAAEEVGRPVLAADKDVGAPRPVILLLAVRRLSALLRLSTNRLKIANL